MKIKHELFKGPIMATVKLLGLYSSLPTYSFQVLFMLLFFGLPFFPIFKYSSVAENEIPAFLVFIYFIFYLIFTLILGKYISRLGKQWPKKEYDKLNTDQVTFPFILVLGILALFHFLLFISINATLKLFMH